jgi:hypothetical protein
MLTGAYGALVKDTSNSKNTLKCMRLKSRKNVIFNIKIAFFISLTMGH